MAAVDSLQISAALDWLHYPLAGHTAQSWLITVAVAAFAFIVLRVAGGFLISRVNALARHTSTQWDDIFASALRRTHWSFYTVIALYIAGVWYMQADLAQRVLGPIVMVTFIAQCGFWANAALGTWLEEYRSKKEQEDTGALTHLGALRFITRLVLWSIVLIMVLDNLGVEIGPIIAGMGVGGIAVALAVQNILGDLFASLSIVLDKPFVVGDFVIVENYLGKVEKVGLKTTRVRSLSGEQIVFSNNDLLGSRLRNYGRLFERRIAFDVGVIYQTTREQLEKIPEIIRDAIEAQDGTRFDRSHFKGFGAYSLDFESVYFVLSPDYNRYMDIQQAINLAIFEAFENAGIEFAYPTRTLFVSADDGVRDLVESS